MLLPRLARLAPALRLRRSPIAAFFSSTASAKMKVVPVPVRDDNYAYLLIDDSTNKAAAVDPYDVPKVQAAAEKAGVQIVAGITTHHHFDHSGGNQVSTCYTHKPPLCGWILTQGSRPQAFVRNTLCDVADRACSDHGLCSRLHTRTCRYMAGAPRSLHSRTRSRTRMSSASQVSTSGKSRFRHSYASLRSQRPATAHPACGHSPPRLTASAPHPFHVPPTSDNTPRAGASPRRATPRTRSATS